VFALGGVVLQLPLGWLADHMHHQRGKDVLHGPAFSVGANG